MTAPRPESTRTAADMGPLVHRFDHAIFAIRDLAEGSRRFEELGFDVEPGGSHPGRGTHNAIVRFGVEYIELMSVRDRAEREAVGPEGRPLLDFLGEHEGGWFGWCGATERLDELIAHLRQRGYDASGLAMSRRRPDQRELAWRLLTVNPRPAGWPGVIEWVQSDEERLAWEPPGRHPIGAVAVAGLVVGVGPDTNAFPVMCDDLALGERLDPDRCRLGPVLVESVGGAAGGQRVTEVALTVPDLAQMHGRLARAGLSPVEVDADRYVIPDHALFGARLALTSRDLAADSAPAPAGDP